MNPRSGDESPTAPELLARAEAAGVEARELGSEDDARSLAREAAGRGAPALGMAGGDGSLGPVADVALERDVPFVVVPFGTRNHFARDLGLDRDDPLGALDAFGGRERRVDAALVNGRIFLNNVSLGVYASFVHDPARKTRNRLQAFARMAPAALGRSRRPLALSFDVDGRRQERLALVALVANNDYTMTSMAELGERSRLDEGLLHAYVIEAVGRRALLAMLALAVAGRAEKAEGWVEWESGGFRVEARRPRVRAALDGEPVILEPPLDFEIRPRELRVLVPAP
ncbi:MAG TPA: diacylglycerol kinase family protein [Gaiellaceae bacterium]|nr:diacylglycerol kinase family protein [Gaiellaceae bacterium]